jgi:hypothetical protein
MNFNNVVDTIVLGRGSRNPNEAKEAQARVHFLESISEKNGMKIRGEILRLIGGIGFIRIKAIREEGGRQSTFVLDLVPQSQEGFPPQFLTKLRNQITAVLWETEFICS